jgi:hypothetical protein
VRVFFFVLDLFFSFASFGFVLAALFTTRSFVAAAALFSLLLLSSSSLRSVAYPRLSAPASTCPFPFWDRPLFFHPRSPQRLHSGISTSRRCLLEAVSVAARAGLSRGGDISFIRPPAHFFFGRILEASGAHPFAEVVPRRREHRRPRAFRDWTGILLFIYFRDEKGVFARSQ